MKLIYRTLFACLLPFFTFASGDNFNTGAKSAGMGHASATLVDAFAAHNNQAALGFVDRFSFGVFSETRFLLADLKYISGSVAIPTNSGTFGLSFNYFGFELYNEKKAGLAFGKKFGEKFAAGIQVDYIGLSIPEYGQKHLVTAEAGVLFKALPELHIGAHVYNPLRLKIETSEEENLPTVLKLGMSYHPSDKVTIAAEAEKDIDHATIFKFGLNYAIVKQFHIRGGVSTKPTIASFGFGINLKDISIDLSSSIHPTLGVTPQIGLIYSLPKKKKEVE